MSGCNSRLVGTIRRAVFPGPFRHERFATYHAGFLNQRNILPSFVSVLTMPLAPLRRFVPCFSEWTNLVKMLELLFKSLPNQWMLTTMFDNRQRLKVANVVIKRVVVDMMYVNASACLFLVSSLPNSNMKTLSVFPVGIGS